MAKTIVAHWSRRATNAIFGALASTAVSVLSAEPAHADGWGCQVMLCLSDPRGPETEGACVPPIEKLWDALSHGHPFPTCDLMESRDSLSPEIRSAIPPDVLQTLQSTTISGGNAGASGSYCPYDLMYHDSRIGPACRARSVIQVKVDGQVFTRVWWGISGGLFGGAQSQTEYFGAGSTTPFYDPAQSAQRWIDENNCNETSALGCVSYGKGSNH
ncbi:hypothetical protein GWC77_25920 [Paraburkholderia sp. NMBU_R16]|uniref:hypothetical protein n=1 Tax=Paraburkholderia sp. NMBU_R16 TaxID=2698676 RepID=UPI001564C2FE|nr:hypothetical protein [Paraburkholderia sp. NMBU_R16]NRO99328.1 hypothetical protein [Paraburkholderia sp. NMBU_R16]